jgi:hypothetical protein
MQRIARRKSLCALAFGVLMCGLSSAAKSGISSGADIKQKLRSSLSVGWTLTEFRVVQKSDFKADEKETFQGYKATLERRSGGAHLNDGSNNRPHQSAVRTEQIALWIIKPDRHLKRETQDFQQNQQEIQGCGGLTEVGHNNSLLVLSESDSCQAPDEQQLERVRRGLSLHPPSD